MKTRREALVILAVLVLVAGSLLIWLSNRSTPVDVRPEVLEDGTYRVGTLPDHGGDAVEHATQILPLALSYDYRTLDEGLDGATSGMTEMFGDEFRETFDKTARPMARDTKAVTRALVRGGGVVSIDDDGAVCLFFVDQVLVSSSTKTSNAPREVGESRVRVELEKEDGVWKVDAIAPF